MQVFDSVPIEQALALRDYVGRASWFLVLFLAGLLGRMALAWVKKVNDAVSRFERVEAKCDERHKYDKRRK
jgi:hypothetical protein